MMNAMLEAQAAKKDAAAKRRKEKKEDETHVSFKGYINFTPNDEQRAHFEGWLGETDLLETSLSDAIARGYTISFKGDVRNHAYMASASRWEACYEDAGYIHTERSANVLRALAKLAWYMAQIAYDGLPIPDETSTYVDEW